MEREEDISYLVSQVGLPSGKTLVYRCRNMGRQNDEGKIMTVKI